MISFDLLIGCSLIILIDIVGGQERYERKDYSLIIEKYC